MLTDEMRYRLLKLLKSNPKLSQRELASELGVSLGKVNYCLKALVGKGLIKAANFKNSRSKIAYAYLLTPRGIEEKARLAMRFLHRKAAEYEELRSEIEEIRKEAGKATRESGTRIRTGTSARRTMS